MDLPQQPGDGEGCGKQDGSRNVAGDAQGRRRAGDGRRPQHEEVPSERLCGWRRACPQSRKRRTEAGRTQQAARFAARQSGSGRRAHAAARSPSESAPFRSRVGSQATMAAYPTFSPVSNAVRSVSCSGGAAFPSLRAARGASLRAASCACAEGFPCVFVAALRQRSFPLGLREALLCPAGGVPASCAPRMPAREFPALCTLRAPPAASSRAPHSACPRPARPRPMPDETASSPSIIETTARPAPRNTEWRVVAKRIRSAGVPPSNHTLRSPSFGVLERKVGAVPNFVASEGSACPIPDDGRTGSRLVGRVAHTGAKRGRFRERKRRREEPRGEKHG